MCRSTTQSPHKIKFSRLKMYIHFEEMCTFLNYYVNYILIFISCMNLQIIPRLSLASKSANRMKVMVVHIGHKVVFGISNIVGMVDMVYKDT